MENNSEKNSNNSEKIRKNHLMLSKHKSYPESIQSHYPSKAENSWPEKCAQKYF
jgi:hypothetical protein